MSLRIAVIVPRGGCAGIRHGLIRRSNQIARQNLKSLGKDPAER
jgi:hypothetical protein